MIMIDSDHGNHYRVCMMEQATDDALGGDYHDDIAYYFPHHIRTGCCAITRYTLPPPPPDIIL